MRGQSMMIRSSLPLASLFRRLSFTPPLLSYQTTTNTTALSYTTSSTRVVSIPGSRFPRGRCVLISPVVRRFSAAAGEGPIDSIMIKSMQNKIKEELNADKVTVEDAYGDGRHVSIHVVSAAFEGQSAVNRQRMVYKAIWEELQSTVHAVDQMTTRTPEEAAKK